MPAQTTIKVPTELRDTLQARARSEGRTMAEVVQRLVEVDARAALFARMRSERAGTDGVDAEWERAALLDLNE